eukprot:gene12743-16984_t
MLTLEPALPSSAYFSVLPGKKSMTLPEPSNDLSRSERKAFRTMVQRLAKLDVDVISRASLIEEFCRLETRLGDLRKAEKAAENGSKMAVSRALNVATAERRRLHEAIHKGVSTRPKTRDERSTAAIETATTDVETNDGDEAWRRHFWPEVYGLPRNSRTMAELDAESARLEALYGPPGWGPLLYASAAEEVGVSAILREYAPRSPPSSAWEELRPRLPHRRF